jgi:hypothetical protein
VAVLLQAYLLLKGKSKLIPRLIFPKWFGRAARREFLAYVLESLQDGYI